MVTKIIGSIFIIIGIMGIGTALYMRDKYRLDSLSDIKRCVNIIKSELLYNKAFFYGAVEIVLENSGSVKNVFADMLNFMDKGSSVSNSWRDAFKNNKDSLYIKNDEYNSVIKLADVFSSPDCDYQKTELDYFLNTVENKIDEVNKLAESNKKLYRSISLSVAVFTVILLF